MSTLWRVVVLCCCALLACGASWRSHTVTAWSGVDAYTLVLLSTIDTDAALRDAFYDGAAGTVLELAVDAYTTTLLPSSATTTTATTTTATTTATAAAFVAATSADVMSDVDDDSDDDDDEGATHVAALPLLRVVLSDDWVVLERPPQWPQRPQQQQRGQREAAANGAHTTTTDTMALLHCRLPRAHDVAAVRAREARYVRAQHERYAQRLARWWRAVALSRASRCLYGDAEGALTLTPRYYILCPLEGMWRVRHYTLWRALTQRNHDQHDDDDKNTSRHRRSDVSDNDDDDDDDGRAHDGDALPAAADADTPAHIRAAVLRFLATMHRSRAAHVATRDDTRFARAFERVGAYTPTAAAVTDDDVANDDDDDDDDNATTRLRASQPHWSGVERAWQVHYPTRRRCGEARYAHTWSTTVTFRCPGSASASAASRPRRRRRVWRVRGGGGDDNDAQEQLYWSITEVRQRCHFVVEMTTTAVCAWERALDRLRVSAVPCVALA